VSYKVISSPLICVCDDDFSIIKNKSILYDKHIIEINSLENLKKKYTIDEFITTNDILLPSFSNPHIHLEFLDNKTSLKYGGFTSWLYSVIDKRDDLLSGFSERKLKKTINDLIIYGTTNIGAISSFGLEADVLSRSKLKTIFFNEVLGIVWDRVDDNFDLFQKRIEKNSQYENENFKNHIAIHSPYSTNPKLIEKVLNFKNGIVSTHFMESYDEREWIDNASGELKGFFKTFFNIDKPYINSSDFIDFFQNRASLFTHINYANQNDIELINKNKHCFITTCPKSNRLLGSKKLNLDNFHENKVSIGSDGLSSNNSTNIIDEIKMALFMYNKKEIKSFSNFLIKSITNTNAKSLGLNSGIIKSGYEANFLLVDNHKCDDEFVAMNIILHTNKPNKIYIKGEEYIDSF